MHVRPPIPILHSFDEARARAFYIDFLGFEVCFEDRFDADAPLYMGVKRDQCILHLSEHHGDACPGSALRIEIADVAGYCAELNARKYQNARPGFQDQPWGYRDMCIDDPARNQLIFCQEMPV